MVGDHVSILMRGRLESTIDDMIAKDTYHVFFVSHSGLLQCQYPASVISIMRSLYIDLNEMITQDMCTLIDGVQVSDYKIHYQNITTPSQMFLLFTLLSVQHRILYQKMIVTIATITKMRFCVHYIEVIIKELTIVIMTDTPGKIQVVTTVLVITGLMPRQKIHGYIPLRYIYIIF